MLQSLITFFAHYVVFALMLSMGLTLERSAVKAALRRRGVFVRGLLLVEVVVPLIALAVVLLLPLGPLAAGVILIVSICPGVALIPALARKPGADVGMVLALLLVVSLLAPLTLSAWSAVFARVTPLELVATPADVFRVTVPKIFIPLALGMGVRALWPRVTPMLARASRIFFAVAFVALVFALLVKGGPLLLQIRPLAVAAMILVVSASLLLGHGLGGPRLADRRALALFAALGNPALALAVVSVSYPDVAAAPLIAVYVLLRAAILAPYTLWARRHSTPTVDDEVAAPPASRAPLPTRA